MRSFRLHAGVIGLSTISLTLVPPHGGLAQQRPEDTTVSDVVVTAREAPVPLVGEGAPLYTVDDLRALQVQARRDAQTTLGEARECGERSGLTEGNYLKEYRAAVAIRDQAEMAIAATLRAQQARRAAANGQGEAQALERAELERQAAVNRIVNARTEFTEAQAQTADLQRLRRDFSTMTDTEFKMVALSLIPTLSQERLYTAGVRSRAVPPTRYANLALENITTREREDGRQRVLVVSGAIRNKGDGRASTPPLEITALDGLGFPLKREIADPRGAGRIRPGESQRFSYSLRPKPGNVASVTVSFASDEYEPWRLPARAAGGFFGLSSEQSRASFCFNYEIFTRPATAPPPMAAPRLVFEDLTLRPVVENGVRSVTVSGTIRNLAGASAQTPVFGVVLYDQDDKILSTLRAEPDGSPVPARGTKPFSLTFALSGDARVSRAAVVPNLAQTAAR